jgi:5-methylcytosine-specific restriction endonuclease McrA
MPRAPKICRRGGCNNTFPCKAHPVGWDANPTKMPDGWEATRRLVKARDSGRCVLCGDFGFEVDHIVPRSRGGGHGLPNLRLLCISCHKQKSDEEKNAWRSGK